MFCLYCVGFIFFFIEYFFYKMHASLVFFLLIATNTYDFFIRYDYVGLWYSFFLFVSVCVNLTLHLYDNCADVYFFQ